MNQINPDKLDYEVYSATNKIRAMTNQARRNLNLTEKSYPLVLLGVPETGELSRLVETPAPVVKLDPGYLEVREARRERS